MQKIYYIFYFFVYTYTQLSFAVQPAWDHTLDFDTIEARLARQEIVQLIPMRDYLTSNHQEPQFSHEVYLARMHDGLKAVFKPERKLKCAYAEVAAYKASKFLGLRLVPPTVLKKYKNLQGSLQFFVEHDPKANHMNQLSLKDQSDMHTFCFIFGKSGTRVANRVVAVHNNKYYPALIDNASMKSPQKAYYGDYPFIYKGIKNGTAQVPTTTFPFEHEKKVADKSLKNLTRLFSNYMSARRIEHLVKSRKPIIYCFWGNTLWIKRVTKTGPSYTKFYYRSTLEHYKNFTQENLEQLWAFWLTADKSRVEWLIQLILERKDQVLKAAYTHGQIA